MASSNKGFTLEQNLALFNEELIANVGKLASFIRSYEGGTWSEAQAKAGLLLHEKKALEYIESVRKAVHEGNEPKSSETPIVPGKLIKFKTEKTIFEKNYERLMAIAPGLEQKLINYKSDDEIYGKSESRGYMDFNLELLFQDNGGFHLAVSHYYKENGDMVADPDMEILVNVENRTIEALHFQDRYHYEEVYDDKINRKRVDKKEQDNQNSFLGIWLKNLKKQDHLVKWDEDELEVPQSIIEDKYKKTLKKVGPKKEEAKTVEPKTDGSDSEKAKIESLFGDVSVSSGKRYLKKLGELIFLNERNVLPANKIESRIDELTKDGSIVPYLFDVCEKLKTFDREHLMSLNYYKLLDLIPNLLENLINENVSVQLKSTKSDTVYTVKFGNQVLKQIIIFGIYESKGKHDENATMLIKVRPHNKYASVDHISGDFFELETYVPEKIDPLQDEYYFASLGFNHWLNFLTENEFSLEWFGLPVTPVEPEPIIEFHPSEDAEEPADEPEKYDNDYINKDIPDFEPGHVQLTETHKKYGVTQKVINEINRTQKGKVIFPRKQAMIHNTKDKVADLAHQAQMPGFRISKTGKFYFEGRSNRADRTRSGY